MSDNFSNIDDVHALVGSVEQEVLRIQSDMEEANVAFLQSTKATLQVLALVIDKVNELVELENKRFGMEWTDFLENKRFGAEINRIDVRESEEENK